MKTVLKTVFFLFRNFNLFFQGKYHSITHILYIRFSKIKHDSNFFSLKGLLRHSAQDFFRLNKRRETKKLSI